MMAEGATSGHPCRTARILACLNNAVNTPGGDIVWGYLFNSTKDARNVGRGRPQEKGTGSGNGITAHLASTKNAAESSKMSCPGPQRLGRNMTT